MRLKKLLKDISIKQVKGSKEGVISGVCSNSKLVTPGNLFIAKKGRVDDGAHYIAEAVAAGAQAILTDIYDPSFKEVTQIIHPDPAAIEGLVAATYYQFPSRELFMVGITGTNGKTTTSFLVKHLLDTLDAPCGLIGTIEYIIGIHRYQATRTTPDVVSNHKMLREMRLHGCQSGVMEVTSHALDQRRVDNIAFDVALFTNLTQDHLDYHGTMENYAAAKNLLFRSLDLTKHAIVNRDSPWYEKMVEGCKARILTYGIETQTDLQATDILLHPAGTRFTLHYQGRSFLVETPLVGRFNVYNTLAAMGAALAKELRLEKIISALTQFRVVSGRLEPVPNARQLRIYVDFAHSDDALINVLKTLQELKKGRIITVFGCGGDRDSDKRPKMGKAAETYSDICIVTSDNPRSEDPLAIIKEITKGFAYPSRHTIEVDRRAAIEKAIQMATPDDIVLIAGKGHETTQTFSHKTIEFDDRKVAFQICQQ